MRDYLGRFIAGHKRPLSMTEKQRKTIIETVKRGKKSHNWVGDKIGYWGIHTWLRDNFGPASRCESKKCRNDCNSYNWALKKGKEYERKKENFIQLCRSCHNYYDLPPGGVAWHSQLKKWRAYRSIKGKQVHIGVYRTKIEALKARAVWD